MRGAFTAVVTGEFTTRRRFPLLPVLLVAGAALVSWLATVLVELAVTAGALGAAIAAAAWFLCRRPDRDSELLAGRIAEMHAETEPRPLPSAPAVHYHIHLAPGMTAKDAAAAFPQQRDAITATEQE